MPTADARLDRYCIAHVVFPPASNKSHIGRFLVYNLPVLQLPGISHVSMDLQKLWYFYLPKDVRGIKVCLLY